MGALTIYALSDEILVRIFSFLSARELCRCSKVCVSWCRLSNDYHLWRNLFVKRFDKFISDSSYYDRLSPTQWKEHFILKSNWFSGHCHVQNLFKKRQKPIHAQELTLSKVTCLKISKCEHNLLASVSEASREVHVWHLVEKRIRHSIWCDGIVCSIDFGCLQSRDLLVIGLNSNKFSLWDIKQERFLLHQANLTESALAINPTLRNIASIRPLSESAVVRVNLIDNKLATVTQDCIVRVWHLDFPRGKRSSCQCLHTLTTYKPRCSVLDIQLKQESHCGTWSVSISHAAEVLENWNLIGFQSVKFEGMNLSNVGFHNNTLGINNKETEKYIIEEPDEPMTCRTSISCLSISPCTNLVTSGQLDNTISLWDTSTKMRRHTLFGHTGSVTCTDVDMHKVVSGSNDRTVKVWSLENGNCQLTLPEDHSSGVSCVTFNDQWVVSGDNAGQIKVWDFAVSSLSVLQGQDIPDSGPSS